MAVPRDERPAVRALLRSVLADRNAAVVVSRPGLRPVVERLVRLDVPDVPVLARSELRGTAPVVERTVGLPEEAAAR
jgi:flagellar biosynthesis component FlhA